MARPRIFISSTYYDLKHIRSSMEAFVQSLGYEPILSEKGLIAYNPDLPLDESCYREASLCDIFVLIIGGRYGSPTSASKQSPKDFFYRYDSITKMEYETALRKDIPTYILIEKSVYSEYDTFKNNRDNATIKYAHVDSINVFHLVERILSQPRNNPVFSFEKHRDIEVWLREQWAGLFKDMISARSERLQIKSLTDQVGELANINTTLKRYLEEVVSKVSEENASDLIENEEQRLKEARKAKAFENATVPDFFIKSRNQNPEVVRTLIEKARSVEDFIGKYVAVDDDYKYHELLSNFESSPSLVRELNEARKILELPKLKWSEKEV